MLCDFLVANLVWEIELETAIWVLIFWLSERFPAPAENLLANSPFLNPSRNLNSKGY
jgi:hypothetical protein